MKPRVSSTDFVVVEGLTKHYALSGGRLVRSVDGASFSIRHGEVLGLVGESGCGKSTIAKLLTRLTPLTSGRVKVDGRDVLTLRGEALRKMRRTMQLVFQDPYSALDPSMTIGESMKAPLSQHAMYMPADCKGKVIEMLREVGLTEAFYDRYPNQCSGGQLQRVGIGRALLLQPEFLICDEPTSALDSSMRTQILNLLAELRVRRRLTILMITHDLRLVSRFCDRIAVMYLGQIVEIAPAADLFACPRHPYTQALIASSLLEVHGLEETIDTLRGEPPSPLAPPEGCRLRTRCTHADNRCAQAQPQLRSITEDDGVRHFVSCHHFERIEEIREKHRGPTAAIA